MGQQPMSNVWGLWGEDDEAGALNRIGADQVRAGTALVSDGVVVRLGQDLGPRTPMSPHRKQPERFMTRDGGDYAAGARRPGGFQFAEEVVSFAAHTATHIDALAHAWYDDRLYNGFPSSTVRSTTGAQRCGADKLRPIATRGVLLDLAGPDLEVEPGRPFGAQELQRAAQEAGVEVGEGDAVLLHTGWMEAAGSDGARYFAAEPGIDVSGARWLAEAGVAVVGADNYAVEVQPSEPEAAFPVHQLLIRDWGVPLIENLILAELLASGRRTFFFVAAPLPLVGGTAGPVNPIAVL
jgi:kynurenine formamidase